MLVESNAAKVEAVRPRESYIATSRPRGSRAQVESGAIEVTTDYDVLKEAQAILIALQTPLTAQREPDLSIVLGAAIDIAPRLQKGQLVVLESTTYPGTTRERLAPMLERSGLKAGRGLPPRLLARARRSRPRRTGRPGTRRRSSAASRPPAPSAPSSSTAARCETVAPGLVARGGRADEAPREHLPLGQHRARQRAREALRPDGHRRLGGDRRRGDEAVRVHELPARARGWAATACRSTPST